MPYEYRYPKRPEEDIGSPRPGVMGGYQLPVLHPRTQTEVARRAANDVNCSATSPAPVPNLLGTLNKAKPRIVALTQKRISGLASSWGRFLLIEDIKNQARESQRTREY